MTIYFKALDLWDSISERYPPPEGELPDDATAAQVKKIKEKSSKNFKALSILHSTVSETIFPRIFGVSTAKEAWDLLKEEFQGSNRTRAIRLLHLKRDFAILAMKEAETVKVFLSRIMEIVN
ncbi:UBN2 domain-containing protein [Cephalotus follicularis]|uniref:UBN2 domain-containing protein n=1 Tax=Cephalotus follicularis TaxID=3775 RepID=A0A1Q3DD53_CEPFO|nr:UBN2 domain-containing protein [Cephalotus follicularis]